mmetsp:Transcript_39351/g.77439  ORF Transcript_39351/g.77439 Transcript_39351/m.77439 type:complete len:93 (-) Transcript_39351:181-459(-)
MQHTLAGRIETYMHSHLFFHSVTHKTKTDETMESCLLPSSSQPPSFQNLHPSILFLETTLPNSPVRLGYRDDSLRISSLPVVVSLSSSDLHS